MGGTRSPGQHAGGRPSEALLTDLSPQVGILLHYSTLATMLWIGVTARNIYKQVTKKAPPCPRQPLLRYRAHVPGRLVYLPGVSAHRLKGNGVRGQPSLHRWPGLGRVLGAGWGAREGCRGAGVELEPDRRV